MWTYNAVLARAVDGDTVDLNIDLGFKIFAKIRVRLVGVDTPERGQPGFKEATDFVIAWFAERDNICSVTTIKTGKYGRWLAHIDSVSADDPFTLNTRLLNEGLAKVYGT